MLHMHQPHPVAFVSSNTRIALANGALAPAPQIKVGDALLGMMDGSCVPSVVRKIFVSSELLRYRCIRALRAGSGRGYKFISLRCTPGQAVWNTARHAMVSAESVKPTECLTVLRQDAGITPIQEQVLLGMMLGDASYVSKNDYSAAIQWAHTAADVDYLNWIARALGDIVTPAMTPVASGAGTAMLHCNTKHSAWIKEMFSDWFCDGRGKHIPKRVAKLLTPLALAFWYMDDGSLAHSDVQEDRACFATCSFDERDHVVVEEIFARLGMSIVVYGGHLRRRVRLNANDAERFFLLVAPYIPPAMQRKLPARYRGGPGWLPPPTARPYKPVVAEQPVVDIIADATRRALRGYQFVTDTHNYFASNVLVGDGA